MSKTFNLATLGLSEGTHEITVKARAVGYTDSSASNTVSYVVKSETEKIYTLSGTWVFNETFPTREILYEDVNFTSNGNAYNVFFNNSDGDDNAIVYFKADNGSISYRTIVCKYNSGAWSWTDEAYRTITFDGKQAVTKMFYDWFTANATAKIPIYGSWFISKPANIMYDYVSFSAQFLSNGQTFSELNGTTNPDRIKYDDTRVHDGAEWVDDNYSTITFVGTQYLTEDEYRLFTSGALQVV